MRSEALSFLPIKHETMENLIDPIIILDEGSKSSFFEDYEEISRRLTISKVKELPTHDRVVYSESTF